MGLRRGADAIHKRNEQVQKRRGGEYIPELRLVNDGDMGIIRILTDDPLDVDLHETRDESISKFPMFTYCKKDDDDGYCEQCDDRIKLVRMFMFWAWIDKVYHNMPDEKGEWKKTKMGTRTVFEEDMNQVVLIKRKFGRAHASWNQFYEIYELYGTWKDRPIAYKRSGTGLDTTYTVTPLEKEPIPNHVSNLIGKLPTLESVAKGLVTSLSAISTGESQSSDESQSKKKAKKRPETKETEMSEKDEPEVSVELPEDTD